MCSDLHDSDDTYPNSKRLERMVEEAEENTVRLHEELDATQEHLFLSKNEESKLKAALHETECELEMSRETIMQMSDSLDELQAQVKELTNELEVASQLQLQQHHQKQLNPPSSATASSALLQAGPKRVELPLSPGHAVAETASTTLSLAEELGIGAVNSSSSSPGTSPSTAPPSASTTSSSTSAAATTSSSKAQPRVRTKKLPLPPGAKRKTPTSSPAKEMVSLAVPSNLMDLVYSNLAAGEGADMVAPDTPAPAADGGNDSGLTMSPPLLGLGVGADDGSFGAAAAVSGMMATTALSTPSPAGNQNKAKFGSLPSPPPLGASTPNNDAGANADAAAAAATTGAAPRAPLVAPVGGVTVKRGPAGFGLSFCGAYTVEQAERRGYGVFISGVRPGGAADKAGGIGVGMQVVELNGEDLRKATTIELEKKLKSVEESLHFELEANLDLYEAYNPDKRDFSTTVRTGLGAESSIDIGGKGAGKGGNPRVHAIARLDFTAADDGKQLTITRDEKVLVIKGAKGEGWWLVGNTVGKCGFVPRSHLHVLPTLPAETATSESAIATAVEPRSSTMPATPPPSSSTPGNGTSADDSGMASSPTNTGLIVVCRFDYDARNPKEMSFQKNDRLCVRIPDPDKRWWIAENGSGETGFVPTNFLKFRAAAAQQHFKGRWKGEEDGKGKESAAGAKLKKGWGVTGASMSSFLGSVTRATEKTVSKTKAGMANGMASARKGGGLFASSTRSFATGAKGWLGKIRVPLTATSTSDAEERNSRSGVNPTAEPEFPVAAVATNALVK